MKFFKSQHELLTEMQIQRYLSVKSKHSSPVGLAMSSENTKVYVVGDSSDTVTEWGLQTAGDISTGLFSGAELDISGQTTLPVDIAFKPDGLKMYILKNDEIYQYTLSTAWDLSTVSYDSTTASPIVQSAVSMAISTDGLNVFILGNDDTIYECSMSTGWDLSTLAYDTKTYDASTEDSDMVCIRVSPDGESMFLMGNSTDAVYQYSLTTAWDSDTISYDSVSLDVSTFDNSASSFCLNSGGTEIYTIGKGVSDTVFQNTLFSNYDLTDATLTYLKDNLNYQTDLQSLAQFDWDPSTSYGVTFSYSGDESFVRRNGRVYSCAFANDGKDPGVTGTTPLIDKIIDGFPFPENGTPLQSKSNIYWDSLTAESYSGTDISYYYSGSTPTAFNAIVNGFWENKGFDNQYALFGEPLNKKSEKNDSFYIDFDWNDFDGIGLFGIEAASINVKVTSTANGVTFNQTYNEPASGGPWDKFVEITDNTYNDNKIRVTFTNTGSVARCGFVAFGELVDAGFILQGAQCGIEDNSREEVDSFGNITLVPGRSRKTNDYEIPYDSGVDQDRLWRELNKLTGVLSVFADTGTDYESFTVAGYLRSCSFNPVMDDYGVLNLEIKGIT